MSTPEKIPAFKVMYRINRYSFERMRIEEVNVVKQTEYFDTFYIPGTKLRHGVIRREGTQRANPLFATWEEAHAARIDRLQKRIASFNEEIRDANDMIIALATEALARTKTA